MIRVIYILLILLFTIDTYDTKDPLSDLYSEDYAVVYIHRLAKSTNAGVKYSVLFDNEEMSAL